MFSFKVSFQNVNCAQSGVCIGISTFEYYQFDLRKVVILKISQGLRGYENKATLCIRASPVGFSTTGFIVNLLQIF